MVNYRDVFFRFLREEFEKKAIDSCSNKKDFLKLKLIRSESGLLSY
jgi:hypothetical protein